MKFLIIEDDPTKSESVETFLNNLDSVEIKLEKKVSWQSGLIEIIENGQDYNFLILDMSMPRYDPEIADTNEEFEIFAGWEILKEMKHLGLNIPTCVFTSYDYFGEGNESVDRETIHSNLTSEFPGIYKGMIYFRTTDLSWKDKLKKIIYGVVGN
jgi:CheY-like chemotaxis protein